ncbi:DUF6152 family protein [uncultured Ramlibacter sp.]|uniref:DUF6152 family protein n=1 Tax=uncultured Ramlibacter sp. TaxID=260755 RepID=UPI0026221B9D|nr:DUF6152 family protein [uncultured Ramlibacter sp.]
MQRRTFTLAALSAPSLALAHHGWSSFDQERPIYLEGKVSKVRWRNPHAELELEVASGLKLPADLASRSVPAQSAPVDAKAILSKAVVPRRTDRKWEIELAPLTRMEAWKVAEIKRGAQLALVGFTLPEEKGEAVLRVEYLFVDGKAYALRSSPA